MFFKANTLTQFWFAHLQQETVSCLTEKADDVLVQFGTTYLCESGFFNSDILKKTETVSGLSMTSVLHCQKQSRE
jgi:hypothetical protein